MFDSQKILSWGRGSRNFESDLSVYQRRPYADHGPTLPHCCIMEAIAASGSLVYSYSTPIHIF